MQLKKSLLSSSSTSFVISPLKLKGDKMFNIKKITSEKDLSDNLSKEKIVDFLFEHLKPYGDSKSAIGKCYDYALSDKDGKGGFILVGLQNDEIAGIVIMNKTGMDEYIPAYILVYIAVNSSFRNQGIGGKLVNKALEDSGGDVALHVEYENPAKRLYERIGFTTKYAEMRIKK